MKQRIGYGAQFYQDFFDYVRKNILQDVRERNINAVLLPGDVEFSDEELKAAAEMAQAELESMGIFVPWVSAIVYPAFKVAFALLVAAWALTIKSIYYTRNAMSAGDNIDVNDLENKSSSYPAQAEWLRAKAIPLLNAYKTRLYGYNSKVIDISGGGSGGGPGGV